MYMDIKKVMNRNNYITKQKKKKKISGMEIEEIKREMQASKWS